MQYLLKSEPDQYSFENLRKDGETIWDGVTNPVAVKHLREMKKGDHLVIYHTGNERTAVGTASVVSVEVSGKTPTVRIKAGSALSKPKILAEIKEEKLFADSPLVHQGRLSVVPLTEDQWHWLTAK
jgi:predicted RNA-binding protein with PUA-like domain